MIAHHTILIFVFLVNICTSVLCENAETKPLILTPYIKSNKIEEARKLSQVQYSDFHDVESYSGYFTVNEAYDSNLFFWFFPSENEYLSDPVLLWLQGGPGLPSMYGLFEEHGPFSVKNDTISLRHYRWSKNHSVLYIDNPVGTGFSFTNNGYAQNQTQIGQELYEALVQFFTIFSDIRKNDFFIVGESYAGKYVPALAYTIHKKNPANEVFINLKGLLINNGYVDPINQMDFGELCYQLGLVDSNAKKLLDTVRDEVVADITQKKFISATIKSGVILEIILTNSELASVYNYQIVDEENSYYNFEGDWTVFIEKEEVKNSIHVGNINFNANKGNVSKNLELDDTVSVAPWLSELLDFYPVLLFNGQLDVIVPYVSTVNYLKKLNFTGAEEYKHAVRFVWKVGKEVAGYCKKAGFLQECLVRNAGHLVPFDQPKNTFDLIYRFVRYMSLAGNSTEQNNPYFVSNNIPKERK